MLNFFAFFHQVKVPELGTFLLAIIMMLLSSKISIIIIILITYHCNHNTINGTFLAKHRFDVRKKDDQVARIEGKGGS